MKIYVLKQDTPIGYLEERTFNNVKFTYFNEIPKTQYLASLKEKENFSKDGLFLVFKNLLPENSQIEQLKAKLKVGSNIELLLHLEDIHGSYTFLSEENFDKLEAQETKTIYQYSTIKDKILDNKYKFPNILDYKLDIPENKLFPKGIVNSKVIGLSGFQYKFSVLKDDLNKTLTVDDTKMSEYFMKPYSKYYAEYKPYDKDASYIPYLLVNEHIFMTLARDIGFQVPYNGIIKDGQDYHYIIKRFDRYQNQRFDHEEFATLLGYDSDTKYDATVLEVLNEASNYIDSPKELLLFFFFSTIISHGDLHSKNVSLIFNSNDISEQNKQLSPYYDISTTFIYKGLKARDIGLKVFSKKNKIKKGEFLDMASQFNLDLKDFEIEMKTIVDYFLNNFLKYIDALPQDVQELPFFTGGKFYHKPLATIFHKYYNERKQYIKVYIDEDWVEEEINIFQSK